MIELSSKDICDPPIAIEPNKKPSHPSRKRKQESQKKKHGETEQEKEVSEDERSMPSVQDTVSPHVPLLFYLRSTDGLKVQIGDVVKVESFQDPLLISEIWMERGKVLTKLQKFNMNTNSIVDDFFIQCDVNFVCVWDGDKVKSKAATESFFTVASEKFSAYLQSNHSADLRLFYRKLCIGRALRDAIAAGFSNLSSCRAYLGPFDLFCDSLIFGFGSSNNRKFSLLVDGDFSFLDDLLGGRWDIKLGKDENSFFKYVTLVEVSKTRDFLLVCNIKFSKSNFLLNDDYRNMCKNSIIERKKGNGC